MTRRDYVRIAAALNAARPGGLTADHARYVRRVGGPMTTPQGSEFAQWCRDVDAIADALAADNPRFDRLRFWDAADKDGGRR